VGRPLILDTAFLIDVERENNRDTPGQLSVDGTPESA